MTTSSNSIPPLPTNSVAVSAVPGLQDDPSSRKGKSEGSTASSSSDSLALVPVQPPSQPPNPSISNGSGDSSPGNEDRSNAVTSASSMSAISSTANISTVTMATTTATASNSVPLKVPSLARQIRPTNSSSIPPTIQIRPSPPASRPIPIASRPPISTPSSQSAPTPPSAPLATPPHFSTNDSSINGVVQSLTGQALMGAQMTRMPITINVMPRNQPLMRPRLPMHQVGSGRPGQGMSLQVNPSLGSSVSLAPTLPLQSRPSLLPQATIRPTTPVSTTPLQSAHPTLLGMPMGMMLPTTPAPAHSQSASSKSAGASAFSKTASPTFKQTLSPAHSHTASPAPNQPSGAKPGPLPLHSHPHSPVAKSPTVPSSQPSIMGKLPLPPSPAQQFMAMGGRTCPLAFTVGSRPSSSTVAVSLAGKTTPGVVSSIPFSATSLVPIVSKPGGSLAPASLASRPTLVATPMNVSIAGGQTVTVLTQASLPMGSSLPGGPVQGPLLIAGSPVSLSQAGVSLPQPPPLLPISTVPASVGMAATATPATSISLPQTSQPSPALLSDGVPALVAAGKEREGQATGDKQTEGCLPSASCTTPPEPAADVSSTATKTEQLSNEGVAQGSGDFDAINALKWEGDIGHLPGSDLKFRINTLGMIEMVMEDMPEQDTSTPPSTAESPASTGPYPKHVLTDDPSSLKPVEGDKVAQCEGCRRYGYASLFLGTSRFCSQACVGIHAGRKNASKKALQVKPLQSIKKRKKSSIGAVSLDEEDSMGPTGAKVSKVENFNWNSYLAEQKAVGAPVKLFKEPFPPMMRNGFKKGMKLEGVDPCHQSLYCVLTVAEVMGLRLRLHFDGYSECYDFWVNADSPFIFPAGWCEKNGKKLTPPKHFVQSGEQFSWALWMKSSKGIIAPKHLFINQPATSVTPNAFRVGMKLEAVDKKNSSLICVATVNDTLGDKVLIHFDGWDNSYDYWCDISSPYIHPVGWCQENGHPLSPPADWTEVETFTWEEYLAQTKSSAVPARAFKPRPPVGFAAGQRLEVVDKRNPILVRVATVADVQGHRIQIHFDGWSPAYDYWLDDDSPDLHPPGWCYRTGHELQLPITPGENSSMRSSQGGCPTQGCRGIGHIKGAKYTGHHSDFGCPYSTVNMNKETTLQDRLGGSRNDDGLTPPGTIRIKREMSISPEFSDAENTNSSGAHSHLALTAWSNPPEKRKRGRPKSSWRKALEEKSRMVSSGINWNEKCPTPGCNGEGHITGRFTAHHRVSGCPLAEHQQSFKLKSFGPGRGRKRSRFLSVDSRCDGEDRDRGEDSHSSEISGSDNTAHLQNGVHQSIFMPAMTPSPGRELSLCWEQHAKLLPEVGETTGNEVQAWSIQDVANFIQTLPGCQEQARVFAEEQIDGEAFLLLNQSDIVKILNVKLGPALKIYNSILMFRNAMD